MAREYFAKLKFPVELSEKLKECLGKPTILKLELEERGKDPVIHDIELPEKWNYDVCYEKCFEPINVIKFDFLRGTILSLELKTEKNA